jgi:hypothetical protein
MSKTAAMVDFNLLNETGRPSLKFWETLKKNFKLKGKRKQNQSKDRTK